MASVMVPDILILIALILTLVFASIRTSYKGIRLWKNETIAKKLSSNFDVSMTEISPVPKMENNKKHMQLESKSDDSSSQKSDTVKSEESSDTMADNIRFETEDEAHKIICTRIKSIDIVSNGNHQISMHTSIRNKSSSELNMHKIQIPAHKNTTMSAIKLKMLESIIIQESKVCKPLAIILILWLIGNSTAIANTEKISGIDACSTLYWLFIFVSYPLLSTISIYLTYHQSYDYQYKLQTRIWTPAAGDICWDTSSVLKLLRYPSIAILAGTLGGLLGIGGGMIVSPLLMELGVIPTVAAATSAMAVLITSSSATMQFLLIGNLNIEHMMWFMGVGIIGTFVGQTVVNHSVKKYGRLSVVIFTVAGIMCIAVILMGVNGVLHLMHGVSFTFSSIC